VRQAPEVINVGMEPARRRHPAKAATRVGVRRRALDGRRSTAGAKWGINLQPVGLAAGG
jgi:hypothetical protein